MKSVFHKGKSTRAFFYSLLVVFLLTTGYLSFHQRNNLMALPSITIKKNAMDQAACFQKETDERYHSFFVKDIENTVCKKLIFEISKPLTSKCLTYFKNALISRQEYRFPFIHAP